MRVATKYPRIAARHLEETGRQAEIVEVKGSVELAPLTGMVEAIVDLTATGTTLRENNLVVREEIVVCTARLIANPVAHKLKAAPIDDLLRAAAQPPVPPAAPEMRLERLDAARASASLGGRRPPPRGCASLVPGGASVQQDVREIIAARAQRRRRGGARLHAPLRHRRAPSRCRCSSPPRSSTRRSCSCRWSSSPGCRSRSPTSRWWPRRASAQDVAVELPQGQRIVLREVPVASAAVYVPGGRAPYPSTVVMGVVTARAAGVIDVAVCAPPGPGGEIDPAILGTCRLCGVERVYRMGGAQAIAALAYGTETVARVDVIVGPGNLYVQEAKHQLSGDRRHRRLRRAERPAGRARRRRRRARAAPGGPRHARPGRARRGQPRGRRRALRRGLRGARCRACRSRSWSGPRSAMPPSRSSRSAERPRRRSPSPTPSRPSTCS